MMPDLNSEKIGYFGSEHEEKTNGHQKQQTRESEGSNKQRQM
jgi:hypothetical protein